ncbi:MAG: ABC transporter ATP-binding protein [Phyllobacteriaceae bacterium]|nr:ABC transporter ATP-binding protein [Phyllobacteriaceae bacterium]
MIPLSTRALSVRLGDRAVLAGLDLDLGPGRFVGLVGPNGAGKSTLLRALAGLVPHTGEIRLDGRSETTLSRAERARLLGYLAQTREVAWSMSVAEVVALGRLPRRDAFARPTAEDVRAVAAALSRAGLEALADRPIDRLSGGETARALFARLIAQETPIVLADEPVAGLDPAHQLATMRTLADLAGEGRTVLASLHDLTLAARFCDRLVVLAQGGIVADGAPEAVLTPSLVARVYGIEADVVHHDDGLVVVPLRLVTPRSEENRS